VELMMSHTNPAARLLQLFERMMSGPQEGNCRRAWARALGVQEQANVALTMKIAEAFALIEDAKTAIRSLPDIDHELYLKSFPAIERILDIGNLNNQWGQYRQELVQPHVLLGLQFCSAQLAKSCPEQTIKSEVLESLRQETAEAIAEVSKDTSIPPALRSLLVEHLMAIQQAIADYWIHGAASLKRSVERAVGALIAHQKLLEGRTESSAVKRLIAVVRKGAEALDGVNKLAKSGFALATVIRDGTKLLS
jgi:hypothetical protein